MNDGLKLSGVFTCYNSGVVYQKHNKITNEALEVLATSLLTSSSNRITHLVMLNDFVSVKSLEDIAWRDINEYIAPNSAMGIEKSLHGVYSGNEVIYQGVIDKNFNPLQFNAAALIVNGNEESSNELEYIQTGAEKVFSIVSFPLIKKASWSDFIVEWRIAIQSS